MKGFSLIVLLVYIILITYIIPKRGLEFDLYKTKFRLFPNWFKTMAVSCIAVSIILFILFSKSIEKPNEYLLCVINLALFIFLFSKQRNEDEFSEQIRFKSFSYSFVSFIGLLGAFGAISINQNENQTILNNLNLHILVGSSMLMSLIYFYTTLYKFKKEV